jgi:hypothetical protein
LTINTRGENGCGFMYLSTLFLNFSGKYENGTNVKKYENGTTMGSLIRKPDEINFIYI